ncbi:hypothetical protein QC762_214040 [Podospora pseudocomata]|uniref:Uncharacterized protein n=1 Tax=Podospora pseudocomata TaxID=2093779 RepID=A0ABR0GP02_9PEZI|nr:hypothetical protein QC762_214040 [Podospora pseudocomata]
MASFNHFDSQDPTGTPPSPVAPKYEAQKAQLTAALKTIQPAGCFVTFDQFPTQPHAGICAGKLIKCARQARMARETRLWLIRRFATRGIWALRSLSSGTQNGQVTCTEIGKELGIDAPIRAELYKMLIYEKGALCKPHIE